MKNRWLVLYFGVALILGLMAACATLGLKSFGDMTAQEKSLFFLKNYNSTYANTMTMANNPNVNLEQKEIVKAKKAILSKVYPLIQAYDLVVKGGGVPSEADEAAILDFMDQLAAMGGGL